MFVLRPAYISVVDHRTSLDWPRIWCLQVPCATLAIYISIRPFKYLAPLRSCGITTYACCRVRRQCAGRARARHHAPHKTKGQNMIRSTQCSQHLSWHLQQNEIFNHVTRFSPLAIFFVCISTAVSSCHGLCIPVQLSYLSWAL
jgi:hypothetical protein